MFCWEKSCDCRHQFISAARRKQAKSTNSSSSWLKDRQSLSR